VSTESQRFACSLPEPEPAGGRRRTAPAEGCSAPICRLPSRDGTALGTESLREPRSCVTALRVKRASRSRLGLPALSRHGRGLE
jgi:hypothetical protein